MGEEVVCGRFTVRSTLGGKLPVEIVEERRIDPHGPPGGHGSVRRTNGWVPQLDSGSHLVEEFSRDRVEVPHDALFEDTVLLGGRERLELRRRPDLRGHDASVAAGSSD